MVIRVSEGDTTALNLLLEKVYRDGGHDFREYKRGTVTRRLERRLRAAGTKTYRDYMRFLDVHPEEYQRLAEDLTIKTSGFFRSLYTFQQVAKLVLPELVSYKESKGERELRFWSTACARGEEPYSIAILLVEFLGHSLLDFDILVYATDISQWALNEAQIGVYSSKEVEALSPATLQNYFIRHNQCYKVKADIGQMVSFSHFDLTSTAPSPFLKLDCIFCCNVLIYLQQQLQERVLSMLCDSLATPGYLILGEVERPTNNLRAKVECLDSKARIYKKMTN